MRASRWVAVAVLAAALAVMAALPAAFNSDEGVQPAKLLIAVSAVLLTAVCLVISRRVLTADDATYWPWLVSGLLLAALAPEAVESLSQNALGDAGMAATALAVMLASLPSRLWVTVLAASLTALACAFDATAVVWPVGWAWAAAVHRHQRGFAGVILAAGVAGLILGRVCGWPTFVMADMQGAAAAIHRDLVYLLPVVMLGVVGFAIGHLDQSGRESNPAAQRLSGWTAAGTFGLALIVLGAPLDVRICTLPLWWWLPIGLRELGRTVGVAPVRRWCGTGQAFVTRMVAVLCCLLLGGLLRPGLTRLWDGLLLWFYTLNQ